MGPDRQPDAPEGSFHASMVALIGLRYLSTAPLMARGVHHIPPITISVPAPVIQFQLRLAASCDFAEAQADLDSGEEWASGCSACGFGGRPSPRSVTSTVMCGWPPSNQPKPAIKGSAPRPPARRTAVPPLDVPRDRHCDRRPDQ